MIIAASITATYCIFQTEKIAYALLVLWYFKQLTNQNIQLFTFYNTKKKKKWR